MQNGELYVDTTNPGREAQKLLVSNINLVDLAQ